MAPRSGVFAWGCSRRPPLSPRLPTRHHFDDSLASGCRSPHAGSGSRGEAGRAPRAPRSSGPRARRHRSGTGQPSAGPPSRRDQGRGRARRSVAPPFGRPISDAHQTGAGPDALAAAVAVGVPFVPSGADDLGRLESMSSWSTSAMAWRGTLASSRPRISLQQFRQCGLREGHRRSPRDRWSEVGPR